MQTCRTPVDVEGNIFQSHPMFSLSILIFLFFFICKYLNLLIFNFETGKKYMMAKKTRLSDKCVILMQRIV